MFLFSCAVIPRLDYPSGKDTVEQLLELPHERREVSFLVSDEARDRCSIRGKLFYLSFSCFPSMNSSQVGSIFPA